MFGNKSSSNLLELGMYLTVSSLITLVVDFIVKIEEVLCVQFTYTCLLLGTSTHLPFVGGQYCDVVRLLGSSSEKGVVILQVLVPLLFSSSFTSKSHCNAGQMNCWDCAFWVFWLQNLIILHYESPTWQKDTYKHLNMAHLWERSMLEGFMANQKFSLLYKRKVSSKHWGNFVFEQRLDGAIPPLGHEDFQHRLFS